MATAPPGERRSGWLHDLLQGATYCYLSGLVVLLGILFGRDVLRPQPGRQSPDILSACVRFDGLHYGEIAAHGYEYDPSARSTVAFFPAYPLAVRVFVAAVGCDTNFGLLAVSNLGLLVSFTLLARYVRLRSPDGSCSSGWVLLAFGVWPTTFFFRMAYAESLFVLLSLIVLHGIARRWPLFPLALVAGLASATRPVGVAVSAAFLWHLARQPGRRADRVRRVALLCPVACWGLLAYAAYQAVAFGDPFAFARTQVHWRSGVPPAPVELSGKLLSLATLEPVRGVYNPDSSRYWGHFATSDNLLFALAYWNPLLFLLAVGLVAGGAARGWLTGPEVVLGAAALAIPYLTRAYEMSMASHGRFAAAVVPVYLVVGRLLAGLPPPAAAAVVGSSAALLACWAALYAAGHMFF